MKTLLMASLLVYSVSSFAEIYTGIDNNGEVCSLEIETVEGNLMQLKVDTVSSSKSFSAEIKNSKINLKEISRFGVPGNSGKIVDILRVNFEDDEPVIFELRTTHIHKYQIRMVQQAQNPTLRQTLKEYGQYAKAFIGISEIHKIEQPVITCKF